MSVGVCLLVHTRVFAAIAGMPGTLYSTMRNNTVEIWAKALPDSQVKLTSTTLPHRHIIRRTHSHHLPQVAVLALNTALSPVTISLSLTHDLPGKSEADSVRDVWSHSDVVVSDGQVRVT